MSFDPEQYTGLAAKAVQRAYELAQISGHIDVSPLHLASVLFADPNALGVQLLQKAQLADHSTHVTVEGVQDSIARALKRLPSQDPPPNDLRMSGRFVKVLQSAQKLQKAQKDSHTAVDHLIVALYDDPDVSSALSSVGLTRRKMEDAVKQTRGNRKVNNPNAEATYDALAKYGHDLTKDAEDGKLDPVIGRDQEIRRVIQVLSRRTKNNPVLIGEPGVGKTAIVEGLARRITQGDVPTNLQCRVISLDLGALIAGASHRGEFEERLKGVLKEVQDSNGTIILFIDEIHMVLGAGATSGSMDAANLLKPMLARGELRCIGATTLSEYKKHVENDPAFERRFQQVLVPEPSVVDTVSILRGLKERYESHFGVRVADAALVAAAQLSSRYITGRFLPDKAIDLIDEACASVRVQLDSQPEVIDILERRELMLDVESTALAAEKDEASQVRLHHVKEELAKIREELTPLRLQHEAEKARVDGLRNLKQKLATLQSKLAAAERDRNLSLAADLKFGAIPDVERAILKATSDLKVENERNSENRLLTEEVGVEAIAEIVSRWTGVPVTKLGQSERERLLKLADHLHHKLVGQDRAVDSVAEAVLRSRAGLSNTQKPTGTFMFLGPTGVGKCWGRGTKLMMYDGTLKSVEDIVRDSKSGLPQLLMGDDSTPRQIIDGSAQTNRGQMYRIKSTNDGRSTWTCNADHILVLKLNIKPKAKQKHGRWVIVGHRLVAGSDDTVNQASQYPKEVQLAGPWNDSDTAHQALDDMLKEWQPLEFECTVRDYMSIGNTHVRKRCMMFQPDVVNYPAPRIDRQLTALLDFSVGADVLGSDELAVETAWVIGMWITDGHHKQPYISKIGDDCKHPDRSHQPVIDRLVRWIKSVLPLESESQINSRVKPQHRRTSSGNVIYEIDCGPVLQKLLHAYNLIGNKHVPHELLTESVNIRTALLEGIIDGDGHLLSVQKVIELPTKDRCIIDGYAYLARSLGFTVSKIQKKECVNQVSGQVYSGWRFHLSGAELSTLHPELVWKRCDATHPNKDQHCDAFKIEPIGEDEFFGFTLDGNGRCLLGDFVVTHNTELAKALAEELFDDPKNMIRIDMSEYMESHSVSRLIGSPPGYVGHEEGGQLTEKVRRRPYSVILFDEIEKASPQVLNILLQVLDEGRLTDGKGRTVDFTNTIIILTSNIGALTLLSGVDKTTGRIPAEVETAVMNEVRGSFKPELLNRLDDIILFQPLTTKDLSHIVRIQLKDLADRLKDQEIKLDLSPAATEFILAAAYSPNFGARPLRRYLEKHITTAVSRLLIEGSLRKRSIVKIDVAPTGKELNFTVVAMPTPIHSRAGSDTESVSPIAMTVGSQPNKKAKYGKPQTTNEDENVYMNE